MHFFMLLSAPSCRAGVSVDDFVAAPTVTLDCAKRLKTKRVNEAQRIVIYVSIGVDAGR